MVFTMQEMDEKALKIVRDYVLEHLDKTDTVNEVDTIPYIVWKCKTLQNWKYLLSTDLHDGMYYELTFNGDKQEWYLDAYKKFENRCFEDFYNRKEVLDGI
mgnify:FL=1